MFKRFLSALMVFSALAIMLGHDFIPHHHHSDNERIRHHHHPLQNQNDEQDCDKFDVWWHYFSFFQHGESGLLYTAGSDIYKLSKEINSSSLILNHEFLNKPPVIYIEQSSFQYPSLYWSNFINNLSGLRAPPTIAT